MRKERNRLFSLKSKKANAVLDTLTYVIIMIAFAIFTVVGYNAFTEVNDDIQSDSTLSTEAKALSNDLHTKYTPLLDNLFIFALVLFTITLIISVFMIDTHPIFFMANLIILVFVFIVIMLLGNAYDDVMLDAELSLSANSFPYMAWIMQHIMLVGLGVGSLMMISLFIKFKTT